MPGTPVTAAPAAIGFYGKAVTHGDFLSRSLPNAFLNPWEAWLNRGLAASKTQLGEEWLPHYLSAPIWRFALSANLCGEAAAAGILMPSVDSIGRHFPMTLACLLKNAPPVEVYANNQDWFSQCEDAALTCLEETFVVESFGTRLEGIGKLADDNGNGAVSTKKFVIQEGSGLGVNLRQPGENPDWNTLSFTAWDALTKERFGAYSLWWSTGSETVSPTLLTFKGMPGENEFARFLRATED